MIVSLGVVFLLICVGIGLAFAIPILAITIFCNITDKLDWEMVKDAS